MDIRSLKRDADYVRKATAEGDDGSVIALKPSKIYFPERFLERQMATVADTTTVVGIFAHVVDDRYSVFIANARVRLAPDAIATVKIDGDSYLELSFDAGSVILTTQEVVQDQIITYLIYNEMLAGGHYPWYLNYDDRMMLLYTSRRLAGVNLTSSHAMLELVVAATSRDPRDVSKYYRHTVDSYSDLTTRPPRAIKFMSVSLGTTNTTSRIMGAHFEQGLNSALVFPSTKVEKLEELLRR